MIPHTITAPVWAVDTRQDGSMLSCWLRQILTRPSEGYSWKRDSSDLATCFQSSVVQFWSACVDCSLSFLFLADRSGSLCGLLLLQPICWEAWCVVHSEMVFCIRLLYQVVIWLTVAFFSSWTSLPVWPLTPVRHFHPHNCRSGYSLLFRTILCKPQRWLRMKISADQQFLKYSEQPVWHQQPFFSQMQLNHLSSPFSCSVLNFSKLFWSCLHVEMRWLAAVWLADHLLVSVTPPDQIP